MIIYKGGFFFFFNISPVEAPKIELFLKKPTWKTTIVLIFFLTSLLLSIVFPLASQKLSEAKSGNSTRAPWAYKLLYDPMQWLPNFYFIFW